MFLNLTARITGYLLAAIVFLSIFVLSPKILLLAQFPSFEIYPASGTPYPTVDNVSVSKTSTIVTITARILDGSGVSSAVLKIRSASNPSSYMDIGTLAIMHNDGIFPDDDETDNIWSTYIDISNTSVWLPEETYFIDISATDNLLNNSLEEGGDYINIANFSPSNSLARINSFSFSSPSANGTINQTDHTISVSVPYGTDLTGLIANFSLSSGASAKVGAVNQVSGATANNFTSPITYTITAEDGTTTQNYVVTVNVELNSSAQITTFSISGQISSSINQTNHTVSVLVPYGTDVTNLVATFTLSGGASAKVGAVNQVSGATANNFTSPITYTITAEDGTTTQNYVVTVNVETSAGNCSTVNGATICISTSFMTSSTSGVITGFTASPSSAAAGTTINLGITSSLPQGQIILIRDVNENVILNYAVTGSSGSATFSYKPAFSGTHIIEAIYNGNIGLGYAPALKTVSLTISGNCATGNNATICVSVSESTTPP